MRHRKTSIVEQSSIDAASILAQSRDAGSAIDAWLNVFIRLLHLPEVQRSSIRSELQEHLRERTRDLMLAGRNETESVRIAIEELGETAGLARRFEAANKPQTRRWLMHLFLVGLTAGAVALGVVTLGPNSSHVPAVAFEAAKPSQSVPADFNTKRIEVKFVNTRLEDAIKFLGETSGRNIVVHWDAIIQSATRDSQLNMTGTNMKLATLFEAIAKEMSSPGSEDLAWDFGDDAIELTTSNAIDRREATLVSYDISASVASLTDFYHDDYQAAIKRITDLIEDMVDANSWVDTGGSTASLRIVGSKLFIQAPKRMHTKIEWLVQQLNDGAVKTMEKANAEPKNKDVPASNKQASTLQPRNVLTIEVLDLFKSGEWWTATRTVGEDGTIRLPLIGDVQAAGHTHREVEDAIVAKLKDSRILQTPIVSVYTPTGWDKVPNELMGQKNDLMSLKAELRRLYATRPIDDPQIPAMEGRIKALEAEIAARRRDSSLDSSDPKIQSGLERLRTIGAAVQKYVESHQDHLPVDLDSLVREGLLQADQVVSPFGSSKEGTTDYWFLSGGIVLSQFRDPSNVIVAHDRVMRAAGTFAALFADGHAEIIQPEVLAKRYRVANPDAISGNNGKAVITKSGTQPTLIVQDHSPDYLAALLFDSAMVQEALESQMKDRTASEQMVAALTKQVESMKKGSESIRQKLVAYAATPASGE